MNISIKTKEDINNIRIAGSISAGVLEYIDRYIKPGISSEEINELCHYYITKTRKAIPASLGYRGFPKSVCISVNDVVCHGIPSNKEKLKNGDILNIDVAVIKNGFYGDTSKMFFVGQPTVIGEKLCKITRESLYLAIRMVRPGIRLRAIGKAIQEFVESENFSVVREYCGHGIGRNLHEDPQILHYDADDHGIILQEGMVFTIEPMINVGKCYTRVMEDGWTVKTKDYSLSAQYEHTILVTRDGCEIITLRSDDLISPVIHHVI